APPLRLASPARVVCEIRNTVPSDRSPLGNLHRGGPRSPVNANLFRRAAAMPGDFSAAKFPGAFRRSVRKPAATIKNLGDTIRQAARQSLCIKVKRRAAAVGW